MKCPECSYHFIFVLTGNRYITVTETMCIPELAKILDDEFRPLGNKLCIFTKFRRFEKVASKLSPSHSGTSLSHRFTVISPPSHFVSVTSPPIFKSFSALQIQYSSSYKPWTKTSALQIYFSFQNRGQSNRDQMTVQRFKSEVREWEELSLHARSRAARVAGAPKKDKKD